MDAEALVDEYGKRVYYLALDLTGDHHDAEDLSQDVLVKACQSLDSFRGDSKPFTWLYRIAVNTYLNGQRKKSTEAETLTPDFETTSGETRGRAASDQRTQRRQMQADIEEALEVLSPRERTAFVLKHEHGLLIREVADAMDVAAGTVKSMLYRATRKLRDKLSIYRNEL